MFRPSQSLLFRPMPVLNKLKIHHPLLLNPRESKQLLNLLTTSFRQQLDSEHPQFRTEITPAPKHEHNQPRRRRHSLSDLEKTPTDRHMHSLLSNPLFNLSPEARSERLAISRDPMEIFDQAVAKGMMTTSYAKACLTAKKGQIVRSSILSIRDGMKESGAGLKVLKWLISSGTANNVGFLDDVSFANILLQFMVAEGLQEAAWKWIKKSIETLPKVASCSKEDFRQAQKNLMRPLVLLVRAEAKDHTCSLDDAYFALSRAAGYLQGMSTANMTKVLGSAGWFLIQESIMSNSARPSPSEAGFESFLSLVPAVTKRPSGYFAHLSLLHPTKPSPDLALDYIRGIDAKRVRSYAQTESDKFTIQLGLDTANFLLEHHRYPEADQVMDFLRANYPKQLGIKEKKQLEQARAEASSLELLEGIGLA